MIPGSNRFFFEIDFIVSRIDLFMKESISQFDNFINKRYNLYKDEKTLFSGGIMDYILRATAANGQIRAFAIKSTELVEYARVRHNTSPVATAALGRLLSGGAMMGIMMKGEKNVLTLMMKGDGAVKNNYSRDLANQIWDDVEKFAKYAFNKSHSAAYAILVMRTAYMKAHYPNEFMAAVLTSYMTKNDRLIKYIASCNYNGTPVLPPL